MPVDTTCYLNDLDNREIIAVLDYNIANILLSGKNYKEAIGFYLRALAMLPDFIEAAGNYAIALSEIGKTDSALAIIRSLKAKYPDFKNINVAFGKLLLKKGDFPGSLSVFKEALHKDPRNPELLYCAGLSCAFLKSFVESERFLLSALQIAPDYKEVQQLLAKVRKLKSGNDVRF